MNPSPFKNSKATPPERLVPVAKVQPSKQPSMLAYSSLKLSNTTKERLVRVRTGGDSPSSPRGVRSDRTGAIGSPLSMRRVSVNGGGPPLIPYKPVIGSGYLSDNNLEVGYSSSRDIGTLYYLSHDHRGENRIGSQNQGGFRMKPSGK